MNTVNIANYNAYNFCPQCERDMHKSVHQLLFKVSAALARDRRRQASDQSFKIAADKPDTSQKISSQFYSCAFPPDSALQLCKITFCSHASDLTAQALVRFPVNLRLAGVSGCLAGGDSDVGVLLYQGALLQLADHSERPASALE